MSVITPDGRLFIMKNIPWTNDGVHLRKFNNETEQWNYMRSKKAYGDYDDFSFIRSEEGQPIRIYT